MSHATTVNDNRIKLLPNQVATGRDTNTRRFAADCDRGDDLVDHVFPGGGRDVNVLLAESVSGGASFHPPDGWRLINVFVGSTGSVIAKCRPESDA
jgi:hypothetical protein